MRDIGLFIIFVRDCFVRIEGWKITFQNFLDESIKLGVNSVAIVAIISTFTGAVSAIQTAFNLEAPYIQDFVIAMVVRDTVFSLIPTLMALVFAGKGGSQISGELGTMQVTEQISALEVMGINAKSFLVLPKLAASLLVLPMLIIIGVFLAILGGYITVVAVDIISASDYVKGIRMQFNPFIITVILVKSVAFGFIVAAIGSF
ncbi:MAG: ABC transporter permease, partial [Bacteroidota bacterium]